MRNYIKASQEYKYRKFVKTANWRKIGKKFRKSYENEAKAEKLYKNEANLLNLCENGA